MRSNHLWLYMYLLMSTVCCIYVVIFDKSVYDVILKKLVIADRQEKLVFSTSNKIKEIDLDSGIVKELINLSTTVPSIAYDLKGSFLYASKYSENLIVRFPYPNDQTVNFETVVSTYRPFSLAFDSENRHLYWTDDSFSGKILRCNSDGSDITTIVTAYNPLTLTLDTNNRWIYYGDGNTLHRVTFDGIEKHLLVNLTARPIGIKIDFVDKRVYWMEYETGDLEYALFNGSDVKTVIGTNVSSSSREIDIGGDYVFCTSYNKILKIHKSLGQISAVVHRETSQIYGLLFYKQEGEIILLK